MNTQLRKETTVTAEQLVSGRGASSANAGSLVLSGTALIDAKGSIVAVDSHWMALAKSVGLPLGDTGLAVNYFQACRQSNIPRLATRKVVLGIQAVLRGENPSFTLDFTCQADAEVRLFRLSATPLAFQNARVALTFTDITDLHLSKANRLQQFAQKLIDLQERERRRISAELHDDLGNRIALISFSLREAMSRQGKTGRSAEVELTRVLTLVTDLSVALRSLSHSLYPPLLRLGGIRAALKSLTASVEQSGPIRITLDMPEQLPKLSEEVQLCIFRVSQEGLHNILKHSDADRGRILLEYTPKLVRLTISDGGRGFNTSRVVRKGGLGLLSMEERALSVGGHFNVTSSAGNGTEVCLTIPLHRAGQFVNVQQLSSR